MTSFRIGRGMAFAVVAAGACGLTALGQQPRPIDRIDAATAAQRIADQKATAEVLTAIQDADRLARTNPARALQTLRAALSGIDLSAAVGGETRKTLTATLQGKIAALEGKPAPNAGAKLDPAGPVVKAQRKFDADAYFAEVKAVQAGVDRVKRYQEGNLKGAADREIADLVRKYPDNPAVIALTGKDTLATNVADSQLFTRMQNDRIVATNNSLMRSSLPPKGDIDFPDDWKYRAGKRKADEVKLSAKEKALIEALDKPVTLPLNNRPLEEALQDLSTAIDQRLYLDKKSLDDLGVDLKKPVSADARGVSARTVLRQLLASQGLTFVVKDEAIEVVTVEKAREMLVTRVYYLGDVVQGVGPFGGALTWGPFVDYQQTMANVDLIMASIKGSIDARSWQGQGGAGTITFHYPSMSIIVRASTEVHASLGSKLGAK